MSDRFVIHTHTGMGPTHYDLMIERGGALDTWRLSIPPDGLAPGAELPVRKLPPHRLAYLDYEGPVSGDRGAVSRYDRGACVRAAMPDGAVVVAFGATRVKGRYELRHTGPAREDWVLTRLSDS